MLGMHLDPVPAAQARAAVHAVYDGNCDHQISLEGKQHDACGDSCATCLEKGSGVSVLHTVSVPDFTQVAAIVQARHQESQAYSGVPTIRARAAPLFEEAQEHAHSLVKRE